MRALIFALLLATPAAAQDRAALEAAFRGWLAEDLWPRAEAAGVSRATFDAALGGVALDWGLPDLEPPGAPPPEQRQAEFRAPGAYFAAGPLDAVVAGGRRMADHYGALLARLEAETGVPGGILVAIWGRESAFGAAALPHDAFRVLATRGFMGRRAPLFADELVAALRLAEAGTPPAAFRSSAAGALGQPQFLPSAALALATDGDGDGRADIWGSAEDTLASIAAFLAAHGWQRGRDWGYEVRLPDGLSCTLEGPDRARPLAAWEALGVARVSGRPFPEAERAGEMFLVLPAGRHGPAFLATPNFLALKDYNTSDLYALFVGHAADRIAHGGGAFAAGWDPVGGLERAEVAATQAALQARGHDTGGTDGLAGFRTRRAIGAWQEEAGRAATCYPEAGLAAAIGG